MAISLCSELLVYYFTWISYKCIFTLNTSPIIGILIISLLVPVEEIVQESVNTRTFNPKRAWRVALLVVKFTVRLKRQAYQGPVTYAFAKQNPYQVKILRRIIDKEVFNIYGHWIKSGEEEGQSRAIMFEAKPKMRRRHASSNNDQNTLSDISFSCGGQ